MKKRHQTRRGLGLAALGGAIVLAVGGVLVAASLSLNQPFAPAVYGGGSTLAAVLLGRWGVREMRLF